MTGDYAAHVAQAQEFGASFRAGDLAFLTPGSIPRATPNPAVVNFITPGWNSRLAFLSFMEEMS